MTPSETFLRIMTTVPDMCRLYADFGVADPGRVNVAITRAKEVFWMIGGSMNIKFACNVERQLFLLTQYKRELQRAGKCHKLL